MTANPSERQPRVLVTGATGYVGGLLVPELLDRGWPVRVLSRRPDGVADRPWADRVDVVAGDANDAVALGRALSGVEVAYYLVHSMDGDGDFVERDRRAARTFADSARAAGVNRIVYLSGLHPPGALSRHLASRVEVGRILMASGVPTAVLQAGVVLGDGSASFDMLRHLTERLPAFVAPKWLRNRIQPIAARDAVHYLAEAATLGVQHNRTFDIGGPEVLTYADMMRRYACVTGLGRRHIVTLPFLTPGLASHWVSLVTPVGSAIARPLVGSLVHDAVCHEADLARLVPAPPWGPTTFDDAIRIATADVDPTAWRRRLRQAAGTVGAAAVVGSLLTNPRSRWYRNLDVPRWQPPPWAFPVVWTALYAEVAIASAAAMAESEAAEGDAFRRALSANMALNAAWSGVFFRGEAPRSAAVECAALTLSSADLARRAARTGRGKGVALGAYAAWCGFATVLSAEIARRNRRTS
jgi:uncharacterized protein YbjT (DUF2867 family)/tryptophan-rich sensory protein